MTTRAWLYCRISLDKRKDGAGVARQEKDCRALAVKLGFAVADCDVLVENSISAYSGKVRPKYKRLLDAIEAGEVDAVITWHPDRLHRSPLELEQYISLAETYGVQTHTVTAGAWDLSTPSGRVQARTIGAFARYESEQKRERVMRQQTQAGEGGTRHGGGLRPFGYTRTSQKGKPALYAHDPIEAPLLRDAITRILLPEGEDDRQTIGMVLRAWNAAGITTVTGRQWNYQLLRSVLLRLSNGGLATYRDENNKLVETELTDCTDGSIVDADTQRQMIAFLTRPERRSTASWEPKRLLSNLAHCGKCGTALGPASITTRGVKSLRYRCKSLECNLSIELGMLDKAVTEAVVAAYVFGIDSSLPQAEDHHSAAAMTKLRAELTTIENERAKWIELGDDMTAAEIKAKVKPLNQRRDELRSKLTEYVSADAHASMHADILGELYVDAAGYQRASLGLPPANVLRERFEGLSLTKRRTIVSSLLTIRVKPGRGTRRIEITRK